MGDSRRFEVFAKWVARQFPVGKYNVIADIAGGRGELSWWLVKFGYRCRIIDPKAKDYYVLPRRLRKQLHDRRLIERIMAPASVENTAGCDVLVGLHPDEATEAIIRCAAVHGAPFAVVPCCVQRRGLDEHGWVRYLKAMARELGFDVREAQLSIGGKNVVVWGFPGGRSGLTAAVGGYSDRNDKFWSDEGCVRTLLGSSAKRRSMVL